MHFHIFWCDVMAQKWVVASPHQIIVIFLQTHGICHRFHISETERHCFCNMPYLKWFDAVLAGRFMLLNMNFILCRCKDTPCARNKKMFLSPLPASTRSTRNVCMCEYGGVSHIIQMMFYNSDIIFNASVTQTWNIHFIMYSATAYTGCLSCECYKHT